MAGRKGEKHWRDAVMLAINEEVTEGDLSGRKKLRVIAEKVVKLAMDGDMQAIKEIGDRLDGKAPSETSVTVNPADDMTDAELARRIHELDNTLRNLGFVAGEVGTDGVSEETTRH